MFGFRSRRRQKTVFEGYLYCPTCYDRTPGKMLLREKAVYLLGLIPLGSVGSSQLFFSCTRCGGLFEDLGEWPFDFGDHAEPRYWDCRECGEKNTAERYHCRRCGKHL